MNRRWPVIADRAVTDRVYETIRDRILRGDLPPGDFVRQEEISQAMGVSRTPVREALMRLVSEGYVERVHRRGFRIAGESVADLLALYPILTALETLACKVSFPALDANDLAALKKLNRQLERLVASPDAQAAIRLNQQFHQVLAAKCGNHRLSRLLDDLSAEVARLEIWSFSSEIDRDQTLKDHESILTALERGDFPKALASLERDRMSAYNEFVETVGATAAASPSSQPTRQPSRRPRRRPSRA